MALTTVTGSMITPSTTLSGDVTVTGTMVMGSSFMRNRIINGAMVIDQRNAGASGTSANAFTVDRWAYFGTQASKLTWGQNLNSITPPTGFNYYLGIQSSSAYSIVAGDQFSLYQRIEGFNSSDLGWGTANAKTVTLSFQVYSSLTGTFGGVLGNSAQSYSYPFTYSIPVANTWTTISVTIAGPTAGTWIGATNGIGIAIYFNLGSGSTYSGTAGAWASANYIAPTGATSVVGTNGATFYITGVQLEIGSSATPFERRLYNQELANCQRYLPAILANNNQYLGAAANTTTSYVFIPLPTTARVSPTGITIPALSNFTLFNASASSGTPTSLTFDSAGTQSAMCIVNTTASSPTLVAGQVDFLRISNVNGYILFTGCEL